MRLRASIALGPLLWLMLAVPQPAAAQDATTSARDHFAKGYALAEKGDAAAAIGEFELAYAASPNPAVLFNLGQAYASVGRSGEAVQALQRYLSARRASLDEPRIRQIEALIVYHVQRSGRLELEVEPADAKVSIDAHALEPGSSLVHVNAGAHEVSVVALGFEAGSWQVAVAAGESRSLSLRLRRHPLPGRLATHCALEGVSVAIDGVVRGRTPGYTGEALPSGEHRARFEGAGYLPTETTLELAPGGLVEVTCGLRVDPSSPRLGALSVTHPVGTSVFLDDAPFSGGPVPEGAHRLLVSGPNHVAEARRFLLGPRERKAITVVPEHTAHAQQADLDRTRRALRFGSYALAGLGVATAVAAVALKVDTDSRYSEWQQQSRATVSTLPSDPAAPQALDRLLADENDIRRRDSWALGLGVFSATTLAASAVLFFSSGTPHDRVIVTAGTAPSVGYRHAF